MYGQCRGCVVPHNERSPADANPIFSRQSAADTLGLPQKSTVNRLTAVFVDLEPNQPVFKISEFKPPVLALNQTAWFKPAFVNRFSVPWVFSRQGKGGCRGGVMQGEESDESM